MHRRYQTQPSAMRSAVLLPNITTNRGFNMIFTAHYMHRRKEEPDYYRTVTSDTLNNAIKQAERYTRKGFIMVGMESKEGVN